MKHLNTFLLSALALPLLFLHAEDTLQTEPLHPLNEEISMTEQDEETSFLEEEFETEIISLKESMEDETQPLLIQLPLSSQPESESSFIPVEKEESQELAVLDSDLQSSQDLDSEELKSIGLELSLNEEPAASLKLTESPVAISSGISVDLKQAFSGAPVIYSVLVGMSIFSVCLWLYSLASIRLSTRVSSSLIGQVKGHLNLNNFNEALEICNQHNTLLSKMLSTGIQSRKYGLPMVVESMKAEAKRSTVFFWQKLSLLNDIAVIAPMLGLLGTVLGMFYAFYDVNRSIESISTLFDGLGISVGTTVAGLIVAIVALILHSIAKYRLIRALAKVENQAQSMVTLLDHNTQA